jgi:hypothetical protein
MQHIGFSKPTAQFSLTPTKDLRIWPGETWTYAETVISSTWEKHLNRDGQVWQRKGFTGQDSDAVSFCVQRKSALLCVGAHARFVQLNNKEIVESKHNQAVSSGW